MNALEMQPKCSCGRGDKVIFVCVKTDCPNNKKQPLYCIQCNDDEPPGHDHRVRPISSQTTSLQNMWLELRKDASAKVAVVNNWLATYKDLL